MYINSTLIEDINFRHPYNIIEDDKLQLGVDVQMQLLSADFSPIEIKVFKNNCLSFYIELCAQIFKRFNFKNSIYKLISRIDQAKIIKEEINSLANLYAKFPSEI